MWGVRELVAAAREATSSIQGHGARGRRGHARGGSVRPGRVFTRRLWTTWTAVADLGPVDDSHLACRAEIRARRYLELRPVRLPGRVSLLEPSSVHAGGALRLGA